MTDSWIPVPPPGRQKKYSKPRDLKTSTMKSDPGFSMLRTSAEDVPAPSAGSAAAATARTCWAAPTWGFATSAAAPAAAPFRKCLRSRGDFLDLAIAHLARLTLL